MDGKDIACNICAERNRNKMTQEEVAQKLNITRETYISYEEDAKSIKATTLYKLSLLFGCKISDFYLPSKFTKCEEIKKNKERR